VATLISQWVENVADNLLLSIRVNVDIRVWVAPSFFFCAAV